MTIFSELVASLEQQRHADEEQWLMKTLQFAKRLPPGDRWAAASDFLALIVRLLRSRETTNILELGSGISTLVISRTLAQIGSGQLLSLEHHERYYERNQQWLCEHHLTEHAEIRYAPLENCSWEGGAGRWYAPSALPPIGNFDLLVIDGPPAWARLDARYPALPILHERLSKDAIILLDDYKRLAERRTVHRWRLLFPQLQVAHIATLKGTAILHFAADTC